MKSPKEFLESMSNFDSLLDHPDGETCGMCFHAKIWGEVAREMLEAEEYDIEVWGDRTKKRWEDSKFFKLWQEETAAGREPHAAFAERGWEP